MVAAVCLLALVGGAVPALAMNIRGTGGDDTLRGSAVGDWIDGKVGNDRLFGLGGGDILIGGGGADRVSGGAGADRLLLRDDVRDSAACGPGRDTVIADRQDAVKSDCEVVRRPSSPTPQPPTPLPPPPPPPPPAPPPPPPISAGSYKGATQTGNFVFFDVLESRGVRGWRVNDVRRPCDSGGFFIYGGIDLGTYTIPIQTNGQFVLEYDYSTTITWDENGDQSPARAHNRIVGFIQGQSASGTVLSTFTFTREGHEYHCSNGNESWTASRVQ
jgi:hypothetical protein